MLIEFRVKNFRSFRDEQVFTMIASSDKTLPDNVAVTPSFYYTRVVKSAVVLGANASGKSNLIAAIEAPFKQIINQDEVTLAGFDPFLLNETSEQEPSEFSYEFVVDGVRYLYRIAVGPTEILLEELTSYPKKVPRLLFRRVAKQYVDAGGKDIKEKYNREFGSKLRLINSITPPTHSLLKSVALADLTPFNKVWLWLKTHFTTISASKFDRLSERNFANILGRSFNQDGELRNFATQLARVADIGIKDIISEDTNLTEMELAQTFGRQVPRYSLQFIHHGETTNALLDLKKQSFGTQQLLLLSAALYLTLEGGMVLIVDELDSSLHPRLVRYIIELFHNPAVNRRNAQLIFNTHDATLLDTGLFRRDQIWFTEKGEDGASTLFPLTSFSPRKGEALVRGYLLGRYGAVPVLGEPETLIPALEASSSNGAIAYEEGDDGEA